MMDVTGNFESRLDTRLEVAQNDVEIQEESGINEVNWGIIKDVLIEYKADMWMCEHSFDSDDRIEANKGVLLRKLLVAYKNGEDDPNYNIVRAIRDSL